MYINRHLGDVYTMAKITSFYKQKIILFFETHLLRAIIV
jgi:hypothetical protein